MAFIVDARTLSCPQPVILTQKALEESDAVTTIVDNEIAKENVSRLARKKGFDVETEKRGEEYHLHLSRRGDAADPGEDEPYLSCNSADGPIVLLLATDTVGRGSDELGGKLMTAFVQILGEIAPKPDVIILMNSGVKLAAHGSQVIEDLRALVEQGTELLVCGTCVNHYDLKESLRVGTISNMFDIASAMFGAGKVIRP